jgi:hypothetical protein
MSLHGRRHECSLSQTKKYRGDGTMKINTVLPGLGGVLAAVGCSGTAVTAYVRLDWMLRAAMTLRRGVALALTG